MPKHIRVQLAGSPGDRGDVRLNDFIEQLKQVKKALQETERFVAGTDEPAIDYLVVGLKRESPSTVILEPKSLNGDLPFYTDDVLAAFSDELHLIKKKGELIGEPDLGRLRAYRDIGHTKDNKISNVKIGVGRKTVTIDDIFKKRIDKILGPDEFIEGSISGILEALNFHNTNKFTVYPVLGPRKVAGRFPQRLRPRVKDAIGNHVTVSGKLRFKQWSPYPHGIFVEAIDIHPPDKNLPTLTELRGEFSGATGRLNSLEFVHQLHEENW